MATSILSREDLDEIVARLCNAAECDDPRRFLQIFRSGALRSSDCELERIRITQGLQRVALEKPVWYGKMLLTMLTKAADLSNLQSL